LVRDGDAHIRVIPLFLYLQEPSAGGFLHP
jgi:hypothetical protein